MQRQPALGPRTARAVSPQDRIDIAGAGKIPDGAAVAERARRAIEGRGIQTPTGAFVPMTASFGVAAFPENRDLDELVQAADQALYRAKNAGRNRVATSVDVVKR